MNETDTEWCEASAFLACCDEDLMTCRCVWLRWIQVRVCTVLRGLTDRSVTLPPPPGRCVPCRNTGKGRWVPWGPQGTCRQGSWPPGRCPFWDQWWSRELGRPWRIQGLHGPWWVAPPKKNYWGDSCLGGALEAWTLGGTLEVRMLGGRSGSNCELRERSGLRSRLCELLERSGLCELLERSGLWRGLCELLERSGLSWTLPRSELWRALTRSKH